MFGLNKNSSPRAKAGAADTLISKDAKITGNVNFTGVLYIDGYVKGDVIADELQDSMLTIGENGHIEGEVKVPHIMILGKVAGDVHALEHVELMASAKIDGNVYYKLIEMAMGAEVNGQMVHRVDKVQSIRKDVTEKTKKEPEFSSDDKLASGV
jgi:cytoskeletal protein CcmA (bactofilin family)